MIPSTIRRILRPLASLKLAVLVLLGLAATLAAGTILESAYDTPTAQYYVYRAFWFKGLLTLLGINIAAVMADRWPWKPRHAPFLLAHIGILTLLFGAWLTDRFGLDGMMRVSEGEVSNAVELDTPILAVADLARKHVRAIPIRWQPPGSRFRPMNLKEQGSPYDVKVDQFLSHAEPVYDFLPSENRNKEPRPAVKLRLSGGPMRIQQEFWIWTGQPEWSGFQLGPAWFGIKAGSQVPKAPETGARILLEASAGNALSFVAHGSSGEVTRGKLLSSKTKEALIPVPWKGGVRLQVLDWIPDAELKISYKPARVQYRDMAPPPAIRLVAGARGGADVWLGIGDRVLLTVDGEQVEFGYYRRRVLLPISLRLDRFEIERYEGSMSPKSYSSRVTLVDASRPEQEQKRFLISMNEPLETDGLTFYQASYEDAMPRPVTSIFSVNQDPGRGLKYFGSLLIVLGSILLFAMKYRKRRTVA